MAFTVLAPIVLAAFVQEPASLYELEQGIEPRLEEVGAAVLVDELDPEEHGLRARALRFVLLVRADRRDAAEAELEKLVTAAGESSHLFTDICRWLIGRERDALARRMLESRPDLRPGWNYVLLDRFVEEAGLESALEWVRARERDAPEVWLPERARLLAARGDLEDLLDEVERDLRAEPESLELALAFLEVVRRNPSERETAWLAEIVRTDGVRADLRLADALSGLDPDAAVAVLRRAGTREPTLADEEWVRMTCPVRLALSERETLRRTIRARMLDSLRRAGRADEAQVLLEEIVAEGGVDPGTGLPAGVLLRAAGEIQASSGARVVEERVRAAESTGEEDARYWVGRADYYEGRAEWEEVRTALDRALVLARAGADEWTYRSVVDRMRRLVRHEAGASAEAAFLVAELERIAATGRFEEADAWKPTSVPIAILRGLAFDLPRELDPRTEVLWSALHAIPELEHATERLVWRLAERVPGDERDAFWARCLALPAASAPASRGRLGFAMIVADEPARAIPYLQDAVTELPAGEHRDRCAYLVVRAGIEAGDWRAALAAWPIGRARLGLDERPERLLAMAHLAAKEGATDERAAGVALELWRRRANLDAGDLHGLEDLAAAGLRERLVEFYRDLGRRDAACAAPARALALLGG